MGLRVTGTLNCAGTIVQSLTLIRLDLKMRYFWPLPTERTFSNPLEEKNRMPDKLRAEPASSIIKPRGKIFAHDRT